MRRCFVLILAGWFLGLSGVSARVADDEYVTIHNLIVEADSLSEAGQSSQALAKYTDAQVALIKFKKAYPDWNIDAVNFRRDYLASKIAALSAKTAVPAVPAAPAPATPSTSPAPTPANNTPPPEFQNQLNALKDQVRQLQADNALTEAKLKEALAAQPVAVDPKEYAKLEEKVRDLQKEKDMLAASLAQAKASPPQPAAPSPPPAAIKPPAAPAKSADADRIKRLEWERDDLLKKLEAAQKDLAGRKGKAPSRLADMQNEINNLRGRLEVLEAQKVPFTAEELALLKPAEPQLGATAPARKSVRELPAGMAALVSQAQRYFAAKEYEKAEALYQQILREDEKNIGALTDLALIELKLKRFDLVETHLKKALELAPDDGYCLLGMGRLKIAQEKYDEAFDVLSHAARVDPLNPEIQRFLGVVLTEKGQRPAAETAFRKALILQPEYGEAHHDLAYFYLIQNPPSIELARWHYQKSLTAGLSHDSDIEKLIEKKSAR